MNRTAVIVEDDLLIAMELEEILESLGFKVSGPAVTESEAVSAALEHKPDLLFVDFRLAEGNGVSAVEKIEALLDVSVVFVTANSDELHRRRPDAVLVDKPFDRNAIERAVRAVLRKPSTGSGSDGSPTTDDAAVERASPKRSDDYARRSSQGCAPAISGQIFIEGARRRGVSPRPWAGM